MSFFSQNKLDTARIKQRMMNETYLETPDFTETLSLSFEQGRATDQFTSDMNMRERFHEPQMEELETMRADGLITDDVWDSFSKRTHEHSLEGPVTDWQGLADYANSKYGTEFDLTDETMYATVREESHARERQLAKAGGWGVVPQFIAGMGVIATDPVQAPLMLAPGAQMRFGSTAVRTAAKMAFREGMVNVAIEAPLQLSVASFREKVGLEYGLSEGATNLAAAFVFGGAFGAVRGGYRMQMGDVSIKDAIEMQDALIKSMETRGPLEPGQISIVSDLKLSQEIFATLDPTMSVRDGYNEVSKQLSQLTDTAVTAATRATAQADADLDTAAKVGDVEDDFVPELDLETPLDTRRVTETGIVDEAVPEPEPRPIELPEVPAEYRDPPQAEEGPWAETVDTRGQGVQYHGTSTPLDGTDNSYYSTMNIYGQGFYTSDAGDIVRGYSKKGKGGQPTLYTVTPNRALNIYDMELPLDDTMKDILRGMNDDGFNDLLDEFPDISLRELYDERRVYDEFEPADEVQEIFTAVRDTLEDAGFDGLTHVGGKRTGKSAHNVEIYFNPKDDLNMELVEPPKAPEAKAPEAKAPEAKAPETQPRTLGEAYAKLDADTEASVKRFDDYWECMNG